jgi:Amt family ammonium transporter
MTLARQVGVQVLAVAAAGIWCAFATYVILKLLQATVGLRVSEDQEREGLDRSQHGERAYIE